MDEKVKNGILKGNFIVYPGFRICHSADEFISGEGTYEDCGFISSSVAGIARLTDISNEKQRLDVLPCRGGTSVAQVGDVVTAVVTRVTSINARCQLRCTGPKPLARSLRAVLRKENVRAADIDRVDMYKCYRPGDIILARIMPMTELQCYQLTTAEPELGVVMARAADAPPGVNMVPLTWSEMQCPATLAKEPRKVARVAPENVYELINNVNSSTLVG